MIDLFELEQFVAFASYGTLSKAAEKLHISQPTLTRAMQKLETDFGVSLFHRTKNKMELNENGLFALQQARKVLNQVQTMMDSVHAYDLARNTISIGACAPVPMLDIVQDTTRLYSNRKISSQIIDNEDLLNGLYEGTFDLIILPYKPEGQDLCFKEYGSEKLFFALPLTHPQANSEGLYLKELDGENILIFSNIGFWYDLHVKKMPHSRFLVQNERFDFDELVQSSILPSFVSDRTIKVEGTPPNRSIVPILDPEVQVSYYLVCLKSSREKLKNLF